MDMAGKLREGFNLSTQEAVESFIAAIIILVSILFIGSNVLGYKTVFISTSAVFYSIVPVSIALIAFLTYRVARMLYESGSFGDGSFNAVITALLLAVTALNIGFIVLVSSGPVMLEGEMGVLRMSFLIVILSMALSISVISRNAGMLGQEE